MFNNFSNFIVTVIWPLTVLVVCFFFLLSLFFFELDRVSASHLFVVTAIIERQN